MELWTGLMAILVLATVGALMNFGDGDDRNKDDNGSIYKHNSDSDFWKYL